ncbi:hypothetical protein CRUP_004898 [Coryphaenoides rupestris]|nr:hypothetical protein CRUP_004898 [Coryphaenoides rupestris]
MAKKRIAKHRREMLATGGGTAGSGLSEVDQRIAAIMGTTAVAGVPAAEDMDTDQGYHLLSSAAAAPTPDPSPLLISPDTETDVFEMDLQDFNQLPLWKRNDLKKIVNLF